MSIWSAELKELEKLYESFKDKLPNLEKELEQLIRTEDANVIMLYSRRCLEVIITDLCECELKRPRKTEPLKGIIDKLLKEEKVPSHIITSMDHLNSLSTYGTHPKEFDHEQVKPVLNNLDVIIKWYLKYKNTGKDTKTKPAEEKSQNIISAEDVKKNITIPKKRLTGIISGLMLLIVITIALFFIIKIIGKGNQIEKLEKSIAVLPFINDSPDSTNVYFINGIMERITNNLQMIKELRVIGRTSVEQYRNNKTKSNLEIAKELNVNFIVEGSGQRYGNSFSLVVQLIKAKGKETHLWANTYDQEIKEVKDYIRIQSEIAETIAAELKAAITPEEKQLIEKTPTANLTADDLYLKANNYLKEYENTRDLSSYYTSVNLYKDALREDSAFAKAYTGLASAYWNRYRWETYFTEDYLDSMLVLANKALSIDNQLYESYFLKGVYYGYNGQIDSCLNNMDKALKFNPNYYYAYYNKGLALRFILEDYVKCIDTYHKALNLISGDEVPSLLGTLGGMYVDVGFVEKAKYYYNEAFVLDGDSAKHLRALCYLEFSLGNSDEALKLAKKAYEIDSTILMDLIYYIIPSGQKKEAYLHARRIIEAFKRSGTLNLYQTHRIGYAYWQVGKYEEAKYYFNEQIKYGTESIELNRFIAVRKAAHYDLAGVYAFLDEKEKAYKYLDEFSTKSCFSLWWLSLAKHDPLFDSIRNEERFKKILQNMEAKYQAEHERVRKWLEEKGML